MKIAGRDVVFLITTWKGDVYPTFLKRLTDRTAKSVVVERFFRTFFAVVECLKFHQTFRHHARQPSSIACEWTGMMYARKAGIAEF